MPGQTPPEDLSRFLDGELPPKDRDRVSQTVRGCESLRDEIRCFRAIGSDLRDLLRSLEVPHQPTWDLIRPRLEGMGKSPGQ